MAPVQEFQEVKFQKSSGIPEAISGIPEGFFEIFRNSFLKVDFLGGVFFFKEWTNLSTDIHEILHTPSPQGVEQMCSKVFKKQNYLYIFYFICSGLLQ